MANVPRRPMYYVGVLSAGFVLGGFLDAFLRRFLPAGPPKEVLTFAVTPEIGPFRVDLLVVAFTIGPVAITVSLLAIVGVVLPYFLCRSLF